MKDPRLQELVSRLTDAELEAVTICFIEGHGIRGAARRLNLDPKTVRDRLERVRKKAAKLEGNGAGSGIRELDQWIAQRDARDIMVDETGVDPHRPVAGGTLAGDERRLRGIPIVGRGIGGVSPGTRPGG